MSPQDAETATESLSTPDSNWWYWVAAVPLYYVFGSIVGFLVGGSILLLVVTGMGSMGTGMYDGFLVGGPLFVLVVVLLAFVGMVLTLVFPLAIYFDAEALAGRPTEWEPDPTLYGLLGLAGIVAQPLQVALAVYYLYKRHEAVGQP